MRGDKAVAGLLFRGPSEQVSHMFQLSQRRSISLAVRWDEVICLAANILGGSHGKEFGRLYYFLMLQSKLPQIQGLNATQFIILSLGFCKLEVLAWLLRVFCSRFCSQAEIWGLIKGSPRGRAASRIPQTIGRIYFLIFSELRLPLLSRDCLLCIGKDRGTRAFPRKLVPLRQLASSSPVRHSLCGSNLLRLDLL